MPAEWRAGLEHDPHSQCFNPQTSTQMEQRLWT